jgi:ABC-2 type transport system permease protein
MSLLAMSLRSVLRGKRVVAVVLLPLLVAVTGVLLRVTAGDTDRTSAYATLAGDLLLPLVVPLVALVLGVNAFGDERDEHTLGLLLATTLPRARIALTKYAAAAVVTWLACLPAVAGCLVLATATDLAPASVVWSLLLSVTLAVVTYVAGFVLLSLVLRRALLLGLAYLVLWEGLLATLTTAFRNLSIGSYARRIAGAPFDDPPFSVADASIAAAVVVLLVVGVVALAGSARRLRRTHL